MTAYGCYDSFYCSPQVHDCFRSGSLWLQCQCMGTSPLKAYFRSASRLFLEVNPYTYQIDTPPHILLPAIIFVYGLVSGFRKSPVICNLDL